MTTITTHVLDTATGEPAAGIAVTLARAGDGREDGDLSGAGGGRDDVELARASTDRDGRISSFPEVGPGRWRLVFATGTPFFPEVVVTFVVPAGREHVHVPLLLSPYGYCVYRGS